MTNLEIIKMAEECAASIMNNYASAPGMFDKMKPCNCVRYGVNDLLNALIASIKNKPEERIDTNDLETRIANLETIVHSLVAKATR